MTLLLDNMTFSLFDLRMKLKIIGRLEVNCLINKNYNHVFEIFRQKENFTIIWKLYLDQVESNFAQSQDCYQVLISFFFPQEFIEYYVTDTVLATWKSAVNRTEIMAFTNLHSSKKFSSVQFSRSVVSDYLQPHESQHARPPCPSLTPRVHSDSRPSSQ